jgi:nitric oxide dioxygenase
MNDASRLNAQQKRLVRQSFESLEEYSDTVVRLFYGRLFEIAPQVRGLFHIDLREQSRKLQDMLATIVNALDRFDELQPVLVELGRRHVGYGVLPEHYNALRLALLWALGHELNSEFDSDTKAAWDQLLRSVASTMLQATADQSEKGIAP